jgi:hypothetical protein
MAASNFGAPNAFTEAVAGPPDGPELAHLEINGDELIFPIPDGFCPSQSSVGDRELSFALGSPIYRCKGSSLPASAPVAIFVSVENPTHKIGGDRHAFIQTTLAELRSSASQTQFQQGVQDSAQKQHAEVSATMHIDGADDNAVYCESDAQIKAGTQQVPATIMGSFTFTKGYIILIQFVARRGTASDAAKLVSAVKSEAKLFIDDN